MHNFCDKCLKTAAREHGKCEKCIDNYDNCLGRKKKTTKIWGLALTGEMMSSAIDTDTDRDTDTDTDRDTDTFSC